MLPHIDADTVEIAEGSAVEEALRSLGPREQLERGGLAHRGRHKELVAFTQFADGDVFPGYSWRELRDGSREIDHNGVMCHSAVEIQSAVGCPFDCTYCPYGSFVCIRLDVERFVDRVMGLVSEQPRQRLFKLNNRTDTLALEPEYGLASALVTRFSELPGRFLMLYSKGDEVDHLTGLDHGGKTIASFTLSPEPVAALLEAGAPSPAARLAAIEKLARAGYPIRVRFSPIVPIRGWRGAYWRLVQRLAAAASPELVTLWSLSMIDFEDLGSIVPLEELDAPMLAAARAAAEDMRGSKGAPFPEETRAEMYGEIASMVHALTPSTQVALCLETPRVWNTLGSRVVRRIGGGFLCNCGPRAVPEALLRRRRLAPLTKSRSQK